MVVLANLASIGVDTSALKSLINDKLVAKTATQSGNAMDAVLDAVAAKPMDAYTQAHLQAAARRIKAALEAQVELR